jgi:hypothetical protein
MAKKLVVKTGEYTNNQGETKGRYVNIGVVMANANGSYVLLDPTVSLSGLLACQNATAAAKGEQMRDRVMVSVFDDDNQQQRQPQQPQPQQQQAPQQGGWDDGDAIPF